MPELRSARFSDALSLASRLRFEDAREISGSLGVGAREGLVHCLLQSDRAFTVLEDGHPAALWGVTYVADDGLRIGIPWLLAAEGLFERNRSFLVQSRRMIRHLLLDCDVLRNLTDAANEAHLRWLRWCGFQPLRRHERYGAGQQPFIEFYQVNGCRHADEAAVVTVLRRRRLPQPRLPASDPAFRLAMLGADVLDRQRAARVHVDEMAAALKALEDPDAARPRARRACIHLVLEAAVQARRRSGQVVRRRLRRHQPLHDLLQALADIADLVVLDGSGSDGADVVLALDLSRSPAAHGTLPATAGIAAGPRPVRPGGGDVFPWLIRRYVRLLTLDGRLSRVQGQRIWSAAVGAGGAGARRPLGVACSDLWRLITEHHLVRSVRTPELRCMSGLLDHRRTLLSRPVAHGEAMACMYESCPGGGRLRQVLRGRLEGWTLTADPRPAGASKPSVAGKIRSLGDLVNVATAIADRSARELLPGVRLGGVVSGYADRYALALLLRHQLLVAVEQCEASDLVALLLDDLVSLVVTARLEDALLAKGTGAPSSTELEGLLRLALEPWGGEAVVDDDLAHLAGLLLPVLCVPVAHAVQLPPTLLTWHLASAGRLSGAVRAVSDVLDAEETGSRKRYRKFLRTLGGDVDMVTVGRHLGLHVDAETSSEAAESRRTGHS